MKNELLVKIAKSAYVPDGYDLIDVIKYMLDNDISEDDKDYIKGILSRSSLNFPPSMRKNKR